MFSTQEHTIPRHPVLGRKATAGSGKYIGKSNPLVYLTNDKEQASTYTPNIWTRTETGVATERIKALAEPEAQGAWNTMDETKRNMTGEPG
jgi:hypothetical protein